jgi:large subunit ribosomal protein L7/L12
MAEETTMTPDAEETTETVEAPAEEKTEVKAEATGKHADLIKQIETMTVLELADFVKELEDRFGVSAAAPMMVAGPAAAGGADAAPAEEKTSFSVVVANAGEQKIAVIKAVREIRSDLGLKEAKDLVDAAPKEVLANAKKEDAEAAKAKLEAAGATVELK